MNYDAIVVGAGNAGLICALRLAKEGKKVLVLEKHNVPGGFATSFVRGRFEFEASLHELCDYGTQEHPGNVYTLFQDLGLSIPMKTITEAYHVIVMDKKEKEEYTLPCGIENFIAKMEEYVPGSTPSVKEFLRLCKETQAAFKYLNDTKGNPDVAVLMNDYPDFMRIAAYPIKKVLDAIHMPSKAQGILTVYWTYLGSPSSQLSFVHFASMFYSYITLGAQIPENTSHEISMTIANKIEEYGGKILYFHEVSEILMDNDSMRGVKCTNKEIFYAPYVICNCSPTMVYGKMIPFSLIKKEARKLTNSRTLGARGLCLYLGLNESAEKLGLTNYSYFLYHTLDSNKEFLKMQSLDNDTMVGVVLNNANPNCSPKGTTILYLTSLYFGSVFDKEVTSENYFEIKDKIANQMISRFEECTGVSIRDAIEEIELATPLTYYRYTGHPDGTIYGYMAKGYDNLLPRMMSKKEETYVPGLYFCGGFAERLSGYSSTYLNGNTTALEVLAKMKEGK